MSLSQVYRPSELEDILYRQKYTHTTILDPDQLNLFRNRYDTVTPIRHRIHRPCSWEYVPVEYHNRSVTFMTIPGFNNTTFNMQQWNLGKPEATPWEQERPCVLMVFEWTDAWQHCLQDLFPCLVAAKPYLDQHPDYLLVVRKGPFTHLIKDLLQISNPLLEVDPSNLSRNLSPLLIAFEPSEEVEDRNVVSNIRKMNYYGDINRLIRGSLRKRFPELEHPVEPYILYLSREGCFRHPRQDIEIRTIDPRIKVFNLNEQDVPLWDRFKLFYNASGVIAPHGGAIYHVLTCAPGTPVIEIYGSINFINTEGMCNNIPVRYFPLISTDIVEHNLWKPYDINPQLIKQIIDYALPLPPSYQIEQSRPLIFAHSSAGLGDQLFGFISTWWLSRLLNRPIATDNTHILNCFMVRAWTETTPMPTIVFDETNVGDWSEKFQSIPAAASRISSGQNFILALYHDIYASEQLKALCPDPTDLVRIFFQQVSLRPELCKAITNLPPLASFVGVHYRSSRAYSGDAFQLSERGWVSYKAAVDILIPPGEPIVLAADDATVHPRFERAVFVFDKTTPIHIGKIEDNSSRAAAEVDQRAIIELWILGNCRAVVGSYWSNYTRLAALRTKVPIYFIPMMLDKSPRSLSWLADQRTQGYQSLAESFNINPVSGLLRAGKNEELLCKHDKIWKLNLPESVPIVPTVTFVCCPKPFQTPFTIIQYNAILSWKRLRCCARIIVASSEQGVSEFCKEHNLIHEPSVDVNGWGTPLVNSIFALGYKHAGDGLVCYVNSDIILFDDFDQAVEMIEKSDAGGKNYLAVGRNWRLPGDHKYLQFENSNWQEDLSSKVLDTGELTYSCAIDWFLHRRGTYESIPPFAIGKYHWDRWLMFEAIRLGRPTIDASDAVMTIHQNAPWYQEGKAVEQIIDTEETKINRFGLVNCYETGKDISNSSHVIRWKNGKMTVMARENT